MNVQLLTVPPEGEERIPADEKDILVWLDEARSWAKEAGYREEDVNSIIKEVRREKGL